MKFFVEQANAVPSPEWLNQAAFEVNKEEDLIATIDFLRSKGVNGTEITTLVR